jgi:hypothetical protein
MKTPSPHRSRPILAGLLGLATVLATLAVSGSNGHADSGEAVWANATACGAQSAGLEVQFVIDISSSMVTTDKGHFREQLARSWIDRLFSLTSTIPIRVSIGEYGTTWIDALPWTTLDAAGYAYASDVVDHFPLTKVDSQVDTDHPLAMRHASRSLEAEAAASGSPCRMLLWFTDGMYDFDSTSLSYRRQHGLPLHTEYSDLSVTTGHRAMIEEAGIADMCGSDGPVVQMRDQNTYMIVVGLNAGDDLSLVKQVATGSGYQDGTNNHGCDLSPYEGASFETTSTSQDATPPTEPQSAPSAPPTDAITSEPPAPAGATTGASLPDTTTTVQPTCAVTTCSNTATIVIPSLADDARVNVSVSPEVGVAGAVGAQLASVELTSPGGSSAVITNT